jgi:hypothetical protein
MTPQSGGNPNQDSFGTPEIKNLLDVGTIERRREYYMGEGGGFPQVRAVVSLMSPRSPAACPSTKGLMQIRVSN